MGEGEGEGEKEGERRREWERERNQINKSTTLTAAMETVANSAKDHDSQFSV